MRAYGIVTFCDDIRFEQQNKLSLIGCYTHGLVIYQTLPVTLPKLGMLIQVRYPPKRLEDRKLVIYAPGEKEPFYNIDLAGDPEDFNVGSFFAERDIEKDNNEGVERQRAFVMPLIFSPFLVRKEGALRVRILQGEEILRVGALQISSQPITPNPAQSS
jgi:hypothetical protein